MDWLEYKYRFCYIITVKKGIFNCTIYFQPGTPNFRVHFSKSTGEADFKVPQVCAA